MAGPGAAADLLVRRARAADESAVLSLLQATLNWPDTETTRAFFRWKHLENPAGASPAWVAEAPDGTVVGFRPFLRWRFRHGTDVVTAVRAVDAATHPAHQRTGVFSRLTRQALDELSAEGAAFVFNTPNEKSRSGELKLGWRRVGRFPVAVTVAGPASGWHLVRARTAADRWSLPTSAGAPVLDVLGDGSSLPAVHAPAPALSTLRSADYLRWRYGFVPLHYRALAAPDGSVAVFRVRRRGGAIEAAICETFATGAASRRQLARAVLRASGADYAITLGPDRTGLPLPRQGPLVVQRPLASSDHLATGACALTLGDLELF